MASDAAGVVDHLSPLYLIAIRHGDRRIDHSQLLAGEVN
jgi:hypothetical protein